MVSFIQIVKCRVRNALITFKKDRNELWHYINIQASKS